MIRKNSMEEKRLNFNQPLLSVRRGSTATTPAEVTARKSNNCSSNLPPLPYYRSELKSGPVRNPGLVPFHWEQTPGKPKNERKEQRKTCKELSLAPKLPPGRVANHKQKSIDKGPGGSPGASSRSQEQSSSTFSPEVSSINKVLSEIEAEEKEKDEGNENEAVSTSEDENMTYVDARDTLSRTESFFLNCSLSGVSGLDGSNEEPSGTFLDPQVRDFMMGKFLPAAKAVASETRQYASKKNPVAREQPKPVNKIVKTKGSPIYYDVHNVSFHNIHGEGEDEEEDDDRDEYEGSDDLSAKFCGLLPRFCLLNPIPGMRDHPQIFPQVRSVRTKPVYNGASIKNENKHPIGIHRAEVKRITSQKDHANKSYANSHFGQKTTASLKNGLPQSFLGIEKGILDLPEEPRDFRVKLDMNKKGFTRLKELLADDGTEVTAGPANSIVQRTLYIDSEQRAESRYSNSSSSESRGRTPSVDYSLQDVLSHCTAEENAVSQPKRLERTDSGLLPASPKSGQNAGKDLVQVFQKDQDLSLVVHVLHPMEPHVEETKQEGSLPLVLAPLLPKSPSESWLSRTLPSMSKFPTSKTHPGNPAFKQSPSVAMRDRVLRTSNGQHMPFHPPAELTPILEN